MNWRAGRDRLSNRNPGVMIHDDPAYGRMVDRRASEARRGKVKLDIDKNFLLESRGIKRCAAYDVHRLPAQVAVRGLERLGFEHGSVLRI